MSDLTNKTIAALLADGIGVCFKVKGDSMHPLICADDYLVVEPASAEHLVNGDVVLARADRGLTAHRVVAMEHGCIITRGDNASCADAPVPHAQLLGRVTRVERNGEAQRVGRYSRAMLVMRRMLRRAWIRFES
ncbi:MAG TPA: S24/S26 family peptidase [Thermoanaerobaculia bacterium]|nr:S24/S26 family peptidase [Thermoanaerobaculia bacterium]